MEAEQASVSAAEGPGLLGSFATAGILCRFNEPSATEPVALPVALLLTENCMNAFVRSGEDCGDGSGSDFITLISSPIS